MNRFMLTALLVVLATPAFAEGPIAQAVSLAAIQQAPAPTVLKSRMRNSGMYVGGIVLAGAGGYLLGYGLTMEKGVVCTGSYYLAACAEVGTNKMLYTLGGAAMAGTGIALAALGGQRVVLAPSLTGISVGYNVLK